MDTGKPWDLRDRTKRFAIRVFRLVQALPRNEAGRVIGRQLLRAGTSVGANYRAAVRPRSQADFIAKMALVEQEADECIYWMELLCELGLVKKERVKPLLQEGDELVAIIVASIKTARNRRKA
jgi:four helix bundle protein